MVNILVVEDDRSLNQFVCSGLRAHGYNVVGCPDAEAALDEMERTMFSLIVSDIMMPGMDGFALAEAIRDTDKTIPILFLSALDDMPSKQRGYRLGIDDYMSKPVDVDELALHVGALLRRANIAAGRKLEVGGFVMDVDEHTAYQDGDEVPLTVKEFDILYKLLSTPKKAFTRTQLMDEFWGYDTPSSPRTVDVYIAKLREKLAHCPDFEIVTVHGLGYKVVLK